MKIEETERKYSLYRCGECQAVLRNNVQYGVNKVNKLVKVV